MARLTIYKDTNSDFTVVSNRFIDEYMGDANDAQLKVYFYLIRMMDANQAISVSSIADKFNHTEKDIIRALRYWEKHHILDLDFDENENLVGIRLLDLNDPVEAVAPSPCEKQQSTAAPISGTTFSPSSNVTSFTPTTSLEFDNNYKTSETVAGTISIPGTPETSVSFEKPSYSLDQLRDFKNREDTAQLLFVAEAYIGRPLTRSEIETIFFFMDKLHFSEDLIDYLLQYCVDRGKKDFKYIEKVAINWAEKGITTPKQAQNLSPRYDKNVYAIMKELGRNNTPTNKEIEFIQRWTKEYGFTTDIILEACERTVLATDRHRFEYAESILSNWKRENVQRKTDIHKIDELYQKRRSSAKTPASNNKFNQFTQNNYDFDELEKELLSN